MSQRRRGGLEMVHGRARHGHRVHIGQHLAKIVIGFRTMLAGQFFGPAQVRIINADQLRTVMRGIFGGVKSAEHSGTDNTGAQDLVLRRHGISLCDRGRDTALPRSIKRGLHQDVFPLIAGFGPVSR